MAELQTIAHGEGLWDKKANSNFALLNNALEKVGGVVDQLQWTKQSNDGLVFGDGVQYVSGGYSYAQVGNQKLVFLSIGVKITNDTKALALPDLITLPDMIRTNSLWINWLGGLTEFRISQNKVLVGDTNGNANRQWNGSSFVITKLYVA